MAFDQLNPADLLTALALAGCCEALAELITITPMNTDSVNLTGQSFSVDRHACIWTVIKYARGGNWVCSEPDFGTTCQFHESEIIISIGKAALLEESQQRQSGEHFEEP